ncbi:MAG: hypothetical protein KJ757_07305 [Planctomycetes bacterium]|nr:hypothetical protein [Planctomycetota bacterium]MBU1518100.1 hypothetical protein [Planctomycetota bacterium]MBU2458656.1 hypothetical protein [Planctomycetota bacterium]MBU2597348.1 hypothetical protein [Planctomycetota bacterium]
MEVVTLTIATIGFLINLLLAYWDNPNKHHKRIGMVITLVITLIVCLTAPFGQTVDTKDLLPPSDFELVLTYSRNEQLNSNNIRLLQDDLVLNLTDGICRTGKLPEINLLSKSMDKSFAQIFGNPAIKDILGHFESPDPPQKLDEWVEESEDKVDPNTHLKRKELFLREQLQKEWKASGKERKELESFRILGIFKPNRQLVKKLINKSLSADNRFEKLVRDNLFSFDKQTVDKYTEESKHIPQRCLQALKLFIHSPFTITTVIISLLANIAIILSPIKKTTRRLPKAKSKRTDTAVGK